MPPRNHRWVRKETKTVERGETLQRKERATGGDICNQKKNKNGGHRERELQGRPVTDSCLTTRVENAEIWQRKVQFIDLSVSHSFLHEIQSSWTQKEGKHHHHSSPNFGCAYTGNLRIYGYRRKSEKESVELNCLSFFFFSSFHHLQSFCCPLSLSLRRSFLLFSPVAPTIVSGHVVFLQWSFHSSEQYASRYEDEKLTPPPAPSLYLFLYWASLSLVLSSFSFSLPIFSLYFFVSDVFFSS